jgi:hypothetical protein
MPKEAQDSCKRGRPPRCHEVPVRGEPSRSPFVTSIVFSRKVYSLSSGLSKLQIKPNSISQDWGVRFPIAGNGSRCHEKKASANRDGGRALEPCSRNPKTGAGGAVDRTQSHRGIVAPRAAHIRDPSRSKSLCIGVFRADASRRLDRRHPGQLTVLGRLPLTRGSVWSGQRSPAEKASHAKRRLSLLHGRVGRAQNGFQASELASPIRRRNRASHPGRA